MRVDLVALVSSARDNSAAPVLDCALCEEDPETIAESSSSVEEMDDSDDDSVGSLADFIVDDEMADTEYTNLDSDSDSDSDSTCSEFSDEEDGSDDEREGEAPVPLSLMGEGVELSDDEEQSERTHARKE